MDPAVDLDADYTVELPIEASPDAVFEALTEIPGLGAWWTSVTGSGVAGGELRFTFDRPDQPCVMQVIAADPPSLVRWQSAGYDPLPVWTGTTVTFTIEPRGDAASTLLFRHEGLTPRLECYSDCSSGWGHFLPSLRNLVESGAGHPFGSPSDVQRRELRWGRRQDGAADRTAGVTATV